MAVGKGELEIRKHIPLKRVRAALAEPDCRTGGPVITEAMRLAGPVRLIQFDEGVGGNHFAKLLFRLRLGLSYVSLL